MDWPYQFPHPADVIAEEAERTRHLSFEERFDRLMDVIRAGQALLDSNPALREAYRRHKEESEAAWQRAHREVIERYLRQSGAENHDR